MSSPPSSPSADRDVTAEIFRFSPVNKRRFPSSRLPFKKRSSAAIMSKHKPPLKKRQIRQASMRSGKVVSVVEDQQIPPPPPPKLRRTVASCWNYEQQLPNGSSEPNWSKITLMLPPSSGPYVYDDEQYQTAAVSLSPAEKKQHLEESADHVDTAALTWDTEDAHPEGGTTCSENHEEEEDPELERLVSTTERPRQQSPFAASVTPSPLQQAFGTHPPPRVNKQPPPSSHRNQGSFPKTSPTMLPQPYYALPATSLFQNNAIDGHGMVFAPSHPPPSTRHLFGYSSRPSVGFGYHSFQQRALPPHPIGGYAVPSRQMSFTRQHPRWDLAAPQCSTPLVMMSAWTAPPPPPPMMGPLRFGGAPHQTWRPFYY